ncbi:MAG: hypothetical protein OXD43_01035 [Bacteroidetes bacterium]|nr:hypothetical protein [Bacteroidota bacterium]
MRAGTRSERRAGLETGNVSVDLPTIWGRLARLGKRATNAPRRLTGVLAWRWHAWKIRKVATREALSVLMHTATGTL